FSDNQEQWFAKVKIICEELGFALQPKKYKKNPELYPGSIVDLSNTIRVAITGRLNSPDLWQISAILGEAVVRKRVTTFMEESH
ncbi:MAG: glutamate--tRNA ligase, partial [Clostridiales bacterium]